MGKMFGPTVCAPNAEEVALIKKVVVLAGADLRLDCARAAYGAKMPA